MSQASSSSSSSSQSLPLDSILPTDNLLLDRWLEEHRDQYRIRRIGLHIYTHTVQYSTVLCTLLWQEYCTTHNTIPVHNHLCDATRYTDDRTWVTQVTALYCVKSTFFNHSILLQLYHITITSTYYYYVVSYSMLL